MTHVTRKQVLEILNSFEKKYEVEKWVYCGIKIWPFIRIKIGIHLYSLDVHKVFFQNNRNEIKPPRMTIFKKNIFRFKSFFSFFKLLFKQSDYFFAGFFQYRTKINGIWINRFYDVLINLLKADKYYSIALDQDFPGKRKYFNSSQLFFSEELKEVFFHFPFRTNKISGHTKLDGYESFVKDLLENEHTKNLHHLISLSKLNIMISNVFWHAEFYYFFLSVKKPKYIFQICYYGSQMMGLNIAARKLNIPVVDIQHGGQGPFHMSYGNWKKVPDGGYEMLPKYFWCWNDYDASVINEWAEKTNFHQAFSIGNPWMEIFKNKKILSQVFQMEHFDYDKNVILFSLQSKEIQWPDFFVKAIVASKDKYKWRFRVHPTHVTSVPHIKKQLDGFGLEHCYEIEKTSSLPLPLVLANTALHITEFSGVTKEAASMGIFSIMLHPYSKEMFANEIQQGTAMFAENMSFVDFLNLVNVKFNPDKKVSYSEKLGFYEKFKKYFA